VGQFSAGLDRSLAFQKIVLKSWKEIHEHDRLGRLYRGQRSVRWGLQTSLERCCDRHGVAHETRSSFEIRLCREFRRVYHCYSSHLPATRSSLEWLSIMQHHGAPTRLLDFTYSIYIAAYFALEDADADCAVWALDGDWALGQSGMLLKRARKTEVDLLLKRFPEESETERCFESIFLTQPFVKAACPLNPFRLDERLRTQRGVFLVPADIEASLEDNVRTLPGHDKATNLVQIIIPADVQKEAIRNLFQMNISRVSLFPGLDGFSQSLGVYHSVFDSAR